MLNRMPIATSELEAAGFSKFVELCESGGLLQRPSELSAEDVCDGLTDEVTLKYNPIGTSLATDR